MSKPLQCIVLDFDGTFTQVEEEAGPFLKHFREAFGRELGRGVTPLWEAAAAKIERDPHGHGWRDNGHIVAPATADPFLWATSIGQLVLLELGMTTDTRERSPIVDKVFAEAYAFAKPVFRPNARAAIESVLALGVPTFVVTNSRTESVLKKIDALQVRDADRLTVFGNAQKFMLVEPTPVDAQFGALPESETVEGLTRPVMLRRGKYYEVLRQVWSSCGAGPETTLVCGDIFELDIAMPRRLGTGVHLLFRPTTPAYEIAAVQDGSRGSVSEELQGLVDRARRECRGSVP